MARCMQIRCTLQTSPRQLSGPISFNWMGHFLQQLPLSPGQESLLHHAWAEQVLLAVHRVICQTQAKCNTGLHSTKTPIRAEWSLEISAQPPWHCHMKRPPVERGVGACTPCCLSTCWALTVWRPYILFMSRTHSLLYLPTVQGLGWLSHLTDWETELQRVGRIWPMFTSQKPWEVPSASFTGMVAASASPGTYRHVGGRGRLLWWLKGHGYHYHQGQECQTSCSTEDRVPIAFLIHQP